MVHVFSVSAFFIVLREVLEACLIVGISIAYLNRVGATQFQKWVWFGVATGVLISLIIGIIFGVIFYLTGHQWFADIEAVFEGLLFLFASILITWLVIWMLVVGKEIRLRVEDQLDEIIENDMSSFRRRKMSILVLVFVQVLREGIETVIFLIGSANADDVGGWTAIPLPGILAIIIGVTLSFLVFKGLVKLDLLRLLNVSSILLICFAAGLVSLGFHELQEAEWFGTWKPKDQRPWWNAPMWSLSVCCDNEKNVFFGMLRSIFGYQDDPSFIEFSTYFCYWFIISIVAIVINWRIVRTRNSKLLSYVHLMILCSFLLSLVALIFSSFNASWPALSTTVPAFTLSVMSFFVFFDTPFKCTYIPRTYRAYLAFLNSGLWIALTVYIIILHLVEMSCEGNPDSCIVNHFFFFGLIFLDNFNEIGRQPNSWPGIAVLACSLVVVTFYFCIYSFLLVMASLNFDRFGGYLDDNAIQRSELIRSRESTKSKSSDLP